jgi:hypothetical protein
MIDSDGSARPLYHMDAQHRARTAFGPHINSVIGEMQLAEGNVIESPPRHAAFIS